MGQTPVKPLRALPVRPLGRSGIHVSIVGLGTVKFGRASGVKYPTAVRIPSDDEARRLLDQAREFGVTLIDTAPAYGNSEQRLGVLLRADTHPWFVVTKAGESWDGERSTFDFSESEIQRSVARSADRLGQSPGLVLLHSDGIAEQTRTGFDGAVRALRHAREQGRTRLIGASVKTAQGARLACEWADVLMLELGPDASVIEAASHAAGLGLGILAKKALASGHLHTLGPTPIRTAMRRTLSHPGVASVVVGTTNIEHLRENCEAATAAADEGPMETGE
ncbi:MAG: aldo/keto reductase [Planctomycetes bacterium]|nr:aldo/keto reductase [Planctomycetota bacterium]